jgi:hypothetical protein
MLKRQVWKGLWLCALAALVAAGCTLLPGTVAVIQVSRTHGTVPLTISYDATGSHGVGGVSTYRWTFGDEEDVYGVNGSYTFNHAGQYQVTLTVRGEDGSTDTETVTVEVAPAFWVADENLDKIYKLDASGNVILTLDSPAEQPRGLAVAEREGTWSLYVACMGNGYQRMFEVDPEFGTVLQERAAPAQDPGGLTYAPVAPFRVWHVDRLSRKIYEINPSSEQVLNAFGATYFQSSPNLGSAPFLQTPQGIAWREGPSTAGALWVLEAETHLLYELEIVPAIDIFSSTQLSLRPDPIALATDLFPISGLDWYDGFLWVVERDHHQVAQIDPLTGTRTGLVLNGFPGASASGLAIQQ